MFGWASLVALVKNLPAMQETGVHSLDQEDALEEGTATHSSVLAWRVPWTEEPGGLQSTGSHSQTRLSDYAAAAASLVGLSKAKLADAYVRKTLISLS